MTPLSSVRQFPFLKVREVLWIIGLLALIKLGFQIGYWIQGFDPNGDMASECDDCDLIAQVQSLPVVLVLCCCYLLITFFWPKLTRRFRRTDQNSSS